MNAPLRRPALLLTWLLLALLPLRGWANLAMHLPPAGAAETAAPCHGAGAPAPSAHGDTHDHAQHHTDGGAHAATACVLCDLCHGALLLPAFATPGAAPPAAAWAAALPVPVAAAEPATPLRPPRP